NDTSCGASYAIVVGPAPGDIGLTTEPGSFTSPPIAFATDGRDLYFWNENAIQVQPTFSPASRTIFSVETSTPNAIVVDPAGGTGSVYWTAGGRVRSQPKANVGQTPTDLAVGLAEPWRMAADADSLYWTNQGDGTVNSVPKVGGAVTVLA